MRDKKFIKEIESLFQQFYETTISTLKENHPQLAGTANGALIRMQDDILSVYIKRRNSRINLDTLSEYQSSEYNKALICQIYYVLNEGDFYGLSGYDVTNNTFSSSEELGKRAIARIAKDTLAAAGLLYPAANGGRFCRREF